MVLGGGEAEGVTIRIKGDVSDLTVALNQARLAAGQAVASIMNSFNTATFGAAATNSINSIGVSLGKVSATLGTMSGTFGSIGSSFTTIGLIGSTAAAGITYELNNAIEAGAAFEHQMKGVQAVLGQVGESPSVETMKELTDYALKLGSSTIFSPQKVAEGMQILAQAGYDNKKIMASILPIINLATSQNYDLADSIDIIVTSLNAYGYGADQAKRITDVYAAATSATTAEMVDLHYGLKYVLPTFSALGFSVEDATASISTLLDLSYTGENAGRILRDAFTDLLTPTNEAAAIMRKYNLQIFTNSGAQNEMVANLTIAQKALAQAKGEYVASGEEVDKYNKHIDELIHLKNEASARKDKAAVAEYTKAISDERYALSILNGTRKVDKAEIVEYQKKVNALGKEVNNFTATGLLPASKIFEEFNKAVGKGLTTSEFGTLFGKQSAYAMYQLVTQNIDKYNTLKKQITGTDEASRQAAIRMESYESQALLLKNFLLTMDVKVFETLKPSLIEIIKIFLSNKDAIMEFALAFSQNLVPVIKDVSNLLMTLMKWYNGLDSGTKNLIGKMTTLGFAFVAIVGPISLFIGGLAYSASAVFNLASGLTGTISNMILSRTAAVALAPVIEDLGIGFAGAAAESEAAAAAMVGSGGFTTAASGVSTAASTTLLPALAAVALASYLLKKAWEENIGNLQGKTEEYANNTKTALGNLVSTLGAIVGKVADAFKLFDEKFGKIWKAAYEGDPKEFQKQLQDYAAKVYLGLKTELDSKDWAGLLGSAITKSFESAVPGDDLGKAIGKYLLSALGAGFSMAFVSIEAFLAVMGEKIIAGLSSFTLDPKKVAANIDLWVKYLSDHSDEFLKTGELYGLKIIKGLLNKVTSFGLGANPITAGITGALNDALTGFTGVDAEIAKLEAQLASTYTLIDEYGNKWEYGRNKNNIPANITSGAGAAELAKTASAINQTVNMTPVLTPDTNWTKWFSSTFDESMTNITKKNATYGKSFNESFFGGINDTYQDYIDRTFPKMGIQIEKYFPHSPAEKGAMAHIYEWGVAFVNEFIRGIEAQMPLLNNELYSWAEDMINMFWAGLSSEFWKITALMSIVAKEIYGGFSGAISNAASWATSTIDNFVKGIGTAMNSISEKAGEISTAIYQGFSDALTNSYEWGRTILINITSGFNNVWSSFTGWLSSINSSISGAVTNAMNSAYEWGRTILINITAGFSNVWSSFTGWLSSINSVIADAIPSYNTLTNWGKDLLNGLVNGINSVWSTLTSKTSSIYSTLVGAIPSYSDAWTWGYNFLTGLYNGIVSMWNSFTGLIDNLANYILNHLGIFSNAKEGALSHMMDWAPNLMKSYAKGIIDNIGLVESAVASVADVVATNMGIESMPSMEIGGKFIGSGSEMGISTPKAITIQINMPGMVIREDADINKFADQIVRIVDRKLAGV